MGNFQCKTFSRVQETTVFRSQRQGRPSETVSFIEAGEWRTGKPILIGWYFAESFCTLAGKVVLADAAEVCGACPAYDRDYGRCAGGIAIIDRSLEENPPKSS